MRQFILQRCLGTGADIIEPICPTLEDESQPFQEGGQSAFASGLREGDVITQLGGKSARLTPQQFNLHIKLNYQYHDADRSILR